MKTPAKKPRKTTEPRISVLCAPELKDRIAGVEKLTGVTEPTLVRAATEAVCDYVEKHQSLTLPLAVIPRRTLDELLAKLGK